MTDANSKFAFRARSIPTGPATLTIGNQAPTQVNVLAVVAEIPAEPDLAAGG